MCNEYNVFISIFHLSQCYLANRRVIVDLGYPQGVGPVGLAIDNDGDLYSGIYGVSEVIKISAKKRCVVDRIKMPVKYITAVAFGGPKLDTLYVTSANLPVNFSTGEIGALLRKPPNDHLFAIRGLGEKGILSYPLHISKCW